MRKSICLILFLILALAVPSFASVGVKKNGTMQGAAGDINFSGGTNDSYDGFTYTLDISHPASITTSSVATTYLTSTWATIGTARINSNGDAFFTLLTSTSASIGTASISAGGNAKFTMASIGTASIGSAGDLRVTTVGKTLSALSLSTTAITLNCSLGDVFTLTPNSSASIGANHLISGQNVSIVVTTSGTTSYNLAFGSNFHSTGTLDTGGTSARYYIIDFISNGAGLIEKPRTTAME